MLKPSLADGDAGRHRPTGRSALYGIHALDTPTQFSPAEKSVALLQPGSKPRTAIPAEL